jgi:hypothetical protein
MRQFVIALAAVAGFGLLASSGATAAPASAGAISCAANALATVEQVGHRKHRGGWHCHGHCWKKVCKVIHKRW